MPTNCYCYPVSVQLKWLSGREQLVFTHDCYKNGDQYEHRRNHIDSTRATTTLTDNSIDRFDPYNNVSI